MSSTIEGSDDGAREDQLDLGQEDEELPLRTKGHVDDDDGQLEEVKDAPLHNGGRLSPADSQDKSGPRAGSVVEVGSDDALSPQHQPVRAPGSVDETASIPDDTPSLHVRRCLFFLSCMSADSCRDLSDRRQAAVHSRFEDLLDPVPAPRIVPSTFDSSPDCLRHR